MLGKNNGHNIPINKRSVDMGSWSANVERLDAQE